MTMTPEREAEIRRRAEVRWFGTVAGAIITDLLADLDACRAERDALVEDNKYLSIAACEAADAGFAAFSRGREAGIREAGEKLRGPLENAALASAFPPHKRDDAEFLRACCVICSGQVKHALSLLPVPSEGGDNG